MRPTGRPVAASKGEFSIHRRDGSTLLAQVTNSPVRDDDGKLLGNVAVLADVTDEKRAQLALLEEQRVLGVLNRTAAKLNAELEMTALLQAVTDGGVELTGAEFGALFSGRISPENDHFELYALAEIDRQSFEALPLPREDGVVGPLLNDSRIFRFADVTQDPVYAGSIVADRPQDGVAPVRSYLAVPLVSRAGRVIGALFLGHSQPGIFTERSERIMEGIASHAAIAIEKASLFQAAQQEIETRKKAEASLNKSEARFREFAEVGSDLLWETDAEFRVTSIVGDFTRRLRPDGGRADRPHRLGVRQGGRELTRMEAAYHRPQDAAAVPQFRIPDRRPKRHDALDLSQRPSLFRQP